jgi:hypothetical protein
VNSLAEWRERLERFLAADPLDVGCDEAMAVLHLYAELQAAGVDAAARYAGVAAHLAACEACAEDARGLLAAVQNDDLQPPTARRQRGVVAMTENLRGTQAEDGATVSAVDIPAAVTAARLVYADGASQIFTIDGRTTYSERGRDSTGEWSVDDDERFCSFWPPSYRACYALRWMVEGGWIVGLRFTGLTDGVTFEGRYE